jgi:hypothetical protein
VLKDSACVASLTRVEAASMTSVTTSAWFLATSTTYRPPHSAEMLGSSCMHHVQQSALPTHSLCRFMEPSSTRFDHQQGGDVSSSLTE